MTTRSSVALGIDFGTESVRALIVDLEGHERASAVVRYRHGQMTETLAAATGERLPADYALQDPKDWIDSSSMAVRRAMKQAGADASALVGIGVDFTSCTMLPALGDGTPLCQVPPFVKEKLAWPKLWKHHGAKQETDRINEVARRRREPWLRRYGGTIGLEWFFPKVLETAMRAPKVYEKTEVWLEAGDWFVWQLVGGDADSLPRSTCQAGYKAMWSRAEGYPSADFFRAVDARIADVVRDKMPGQLLSPGQPAGRLCPAMAKKLGLRPGIPVSAAVIDAHAGVPGAGVAEAGTLVMVLGTSSCHMLNANEDRFVPGVAGVVDGGILPGFFGYETGQAAVGDAFDWLRRLVGHRNFDELTTASASVPPGSDGVVCIDWMNGCRTPLMDGNLRGAFAGLSLAHGPQHLYRALLEASACGLRWIVDILEESGVPVRKYVATGGLPHHNPLVVQLYADVLGRPIAVHPSQHGPALGAAILGVLAAGPQASGLRSAQAAIRAMAGAESTRGGRTLLVVKPDRKAARAYDAVYERYRKLGEVLRT